MEISTQTEKIIIGSEKFLSYSYMRKYQLKYYANKTKDKRNIMLSKRHNKLIMKELDNNILFIKLIYA